MFYNPSNRNSPGWIVTTLKTRRNKQENHSNNENVGTGGGRGDEVTEEDSEEIQKTNVEVLRSMIVNAESVLEMKQLLTKTMTYRSRLIADINTNLLEMFPYFLTHPELVIKNEFSENVLF